ncbi:amidohydrolase family protein [Hyalangium sp.]|uniref:amidohydrolase family protein n=1 Tax=Hyalangium sp. TaxID=2028555 RepID=UPI002D61CC06|nr:amidohydrolase family protein [Hyalangium sp.]HYI02993.1 amidohydrolase family protein [Hyalangium sp.]
MTQRPLAGFVIMAGCLLLLACGHSAQRAATPPPIIDMHFHAMGAGDQGPPPLAMCVSGEALPVWDQRRPWPEQFIGWLTSPECSDPVWSPKTDDELMQRNLDVLRRHNITALTSGGRSEMLERWQAAEPTRVIPTLHFSLVEQPPSVETLRQWFKEGRYKALAEVTNQYGGIDPNDPAFEPYLALAEELDIPVGIHIGTGPPGAPYLGFDKYRARMHSPLALEEVLVKHPKLRVYVMHAGWPMLDDMLAVMWAHPQVYVDTGVIIYALPKAEFYRYLQRMVDAGFGRRVMFGSDQMIWPEVIPRAIQLIEEAPFLTAVQKRDILYNNAARFLRMDGAASK